MMFGISVTESASLQVEEQAAYYQQESGEALARRWYTAVNDTLRSLHPMPERGAKCDFQSARLTGTRRLQVRGFGRHFIFYRVDFEEHRVTILGVLHGARQLEAQLILTVRP